jgi:NAD(P)-dependent dehydrogenase (short-subunit alcohol dehydrogenase family)
MEQTRRMEDKICLITGASSGIGEATAQLFAKEGARVIVADMEEDKGIAVAKGITNEGGVATFYRLDVTDEEGWAQMVDFTIQEYGQLDILVNNAGIGFMKSISDMSLSEWRMVMSTNLDSVFLGIKHAAPVIGGEDTKGGAIVNVSSSLTLKPSPGNAAYSVSKSGINMLTKIAAIELADKNIRVNTVYPGPTLTPIWDPLTSQMQITDEAFEKAVGKITLFGRMGKAVDIAYAILHLASDEAAFITGAELLVDGGEVLQRDQPIFDTVSDAADVVFK